ncbi:MAG TPA: DUF488 domain-containing protein [Thermomicrobiales bacterium]|nr:DUF488 domain-containing protein [Thermomicrobiales bacterium]
MSTEPRTIYTIGHSNQTMEAFLDLLRQHGIEALADVRSAPYSGYVPHFNVDELQYAILDAGLQYVYLGRELGGRPDDDSMYDEDGHVLYRRVAESAQFRAGLERLKEASERVRVALMCSEEDPDECHRRLLVGRVLIDEGHTILHIRGDGRLDTEADLPQHDIEAPTQMSFLSEPGRRETDPWRSTQSVSRRSPPPSSSDS